MSGLERELKVTICETMHKLYAEGILTDLGGNVSARLPDSGHIWISPSGVQKDTVTPSMLVKIDLEGKIVEVNDNYRPSIESRIHTGIYKEDEDYNAVVHSHGSYSQAYSVVGPFDIPRMTQELAMIIPELPFIPFHPSGTEELANDIAEAIDICGAVIMQNHGLICAAETMSYAVVLTRAVEELLKVYHLARELGNGRSINPLPE